MDWHQRLRAAGDALGDSNTPIPVTKYEDYATLSAGRDARVTLAVLPNEVLLHVLGFLDVSDLLATSRVSPCLLIPMKVERRFILGRRSCRHGCLYDVLARPLRIPVHVLISEEHP